MEIEKFLKWFMAICFILIFLLSVTILIKSEAHADNDKYLQKSHTDSRKDVIYGTDGKPDGYLQQSSIDPRKTVQYDKDGNEEGYWQKSYIDPRKTVFTEKE